MAAENNHINRMQEWLQAHCPVNNCSLLWRGEDEARGAGFRVESIGPHTVFRSAFHQLWHACIDTGVAGSILGAG